MRTRRLEVGVVEQTQPFEDEWDDLADRTHVAPFLRPGWIDAWRSAFGRGAPVILAARRSGVLTGILPLEGHRGVLRSPTNPHTPEFGLLAENEETARSLAKALFGRGNRSVVLGYVDRDTGDRDILIEEARDAGYRTASSPLARSPYIVSRPSLAEHERSLSHNLRHDVRRRMRRLCESGTVSIDVHTGSERLDNLLAEGFRTEQLSWKGDRATAIASRSETIKFYSEIARWAAAVGWLRLAFLRLDGRAIAFQFDLETNQRYYSLKIGYDPAFERFSPGKLLAYAMVMRAVARGIESYELLGTNEPWKERWTQTFRERVTIHAFASSPAGMLSWAAFSHGRRLARKMPYSSQLAELLRR
jgi:CelD/BcsL family acetyltransferase involved in cellulose biosynthesis